MRKIIIRTSKQIEVESIKNIFLQTKKKKKNRVKNEWIK